MRVFILIWVLLLGSSFVHSINHSNLKSTDSTYKSLVDILWEQIQKHNDFILPDKSVLELGVKGYIHFSDNQVIQDDKPLAVIDFSLPSSQKRLWIIDVTNGEILHHGYVAHGRNSGDLMAEKFSNKHSSYMSSLGFYKTAETYQGKHGYSLRLDGLEKGFNDQARERAIVIHGADYAREDFIRQTGRLGRSLGCPALPSEESSMLIDLVKEGGLLFIYAQDQHYLNSSDLINS